MLLSILPLPPLAMGKMGNKCPIAFADSDDFCADCDQTRLTTTTTIGMINLRINSQFSFLSFLSNVSIGSTNKDFIVFKAND
jgi:hypothetical protein